MEFYLPASPGEWLAWSSAAVTLALGLGALFAPRLMLKALRLQTHPDRPSAVSEARAGLGGFRIGVGLSCILLAQPFLWIALGAAWTATAFGRIVSMMSDQGNSLYNWGMLAIEVILAAMPLAYVLGFVA